MAVLGYCEKTLVGSSFYNFIHESERADVFKVLTSTALSMEKEKQQSSENKQQNKQSNRQHVQKNVQLNGQLQHQNQHKIQTQNRQIGRKSPFSQNSQVQNSAAIKNMTNDNYSEQFKSPETPKLQNSSVKSEDMHDTTSNSAIDSPQTHISNTSNSTLSAVNQKQHADFDQLQGVFCKNVVKTTENGEKWLKMIKIDQKWPKITCFDPKTT